jgi:aminoglycoside 3-N-acetyltransferase
MQAQIREHLPSPLLNWLKHRRKIWQAKKRAQLRTGLVARHGTFKAPDLVKICRDGGIRPNGLLFVQCSYNDLLTYDGDPYELLNALRELTAPQGTLLMPVYSTNMDEIPPRPFDVLREPTYTGIIPEFFRREEGVIRSLHPRHSFCGFGPRAKELLEGHEDCVYADGPNSPFDRLRQLEAKALCLGMAPGFISFVHWVEDIEPERYPIKAHDGPYDCLLRDSRGHELLRPFYRRTPGQRKRQKLVGQSLSSDSLKELSFHGIPICIYTWPKLADELLSLRDRGIVYYN